jgi:ribonuclease R
MRGLALVLIGRRRESGAIDFDLPEAELLFNDEGQICGIARSERNIAHRIIEEFMLLANETVAGHLEASRVPSLYRIHEEPLPAKLEEFAMLAGSFGCAFSTHGPVPQRGFQRLLSEISGRPEEKTLSYLLLRSLERARYSPRNTGHFGLAMRTYTHFTSPIRRYPDLVVHRILRTLLEDGRPGAVSGRGALPSGLGSSALESVSLPAPDGAPQIRPAGDLDLIADHSSERERVADEAERELMDWRKAEFMASQVGNRFDGVITAVRDFGFFVELNEHLVEGLVHLSTLNDDDYQLEARRHRFIGKRSGRTFRVGDRVSVVVDRVDRLKHAIHFAVC